VSFERFDLPIGDTVEVCFLRQDATNKTDGVFDSSFLPAPIRLGEVRLRSQDGIDFAMFDVFRSVVIGNGASSVLGVVRQDSGNGTTGCSGCPPSEFGNLRKPCLAFNQDIECRDAPTSQGGIVLPVAKLLATVNITWPVTDRNTSWNMKISMRMPMSFQLATLMSTHKARHEVLLPSNVGKIDILIDRFGTDVEPGVADW